jgi:hypothetical protein
MIAHGAATLAEIVPRRLTDLSTETAEISSTERIRRQFAHFVAQIPARLSFRPLIRVPWLRALQASCTGKHN